MNDEQYFLANAYLDGELTDEERRFAEADPDVMSEVEQLRALQAEVRNVTPPVDAVRDGAIAAAMAEFGRVAETADEPGAEPAIAPVVPYRPRPAYAKYLGVAAAIVTVFGLGIVISQANLGGGDDDDAGAPAADEAAEATFEALPEADAAEGGATEPASTELATAAEESAAGGEATAESAADDGDTAAAEMVEDTQDGSMSEEAADEAADASEPVSPAERVVVPPSFDPDIPILDEFDLGVYGAYLLSLRDDAVLPPTPNTECAVDDELLGTATVVLGDIATDVLVAVDEFDGIVTAIDADSCLVLLDASLT